MGDAPSPPGDMQNGRLFTLRDVRVMMHLAAKRTTEQLERAVNTLGEDAEDMPSTGAEAIAQMEELLADATLRGILTFPVDEPLFLLRGADKAAVVGIGGYAIACENEDAPREHVMAVIAAASAMVDWQRENPDRVQVPPLPEEHP